MLGDLSLCDMVCLLLMCAGVGMCIMKWSRVVSIISTPYRYINLVSKGAYVAVRLVVYRYTNPVIRFIKGRIVKWRARHHTGRIMRAPRPGGFFRQPD